MDGGGTTVGRMMIRHATLEDAPAIAALEAECFPASEAATRADIEDRLRVYPDHFWLLFDGDELVSFVNGMVTDLPDLTDDMYEDASMHDGHGAWQMVFGVDTAPARQGSGCASRTMRAAIDESRAAGRKGMVLTCKERLIGFYEHFGYVDEGVSSSEHGGVVWHQMRLTF